MNELIVYARDEKGAPTACLVAQKDADTVKIGWSARHSWDEPRSFSRDQALQTARGRIATGTDKHIPFRLQSLLPKFEERCRQYFRTDCVITVGCRA